MQRYSIDYNSYTTETDGEWCRHEDVIALEKERDELKARLAVYEEGRPDQVILDAYCECLQIGVKKGRNNPFINEYHSIVKWICRIAGRAE